MWVPRQPAEAASATRDRHRQRFTVDDARDAQHEAVLGALAEYAGSGR